MQGISRERKNGEAKRRKQREKLLKQGDGVTSTKWEKGKKKAFSRG